MFFEVTHMRRPWGEWWVVVHNKKEQYKVKKLRIRKGKSISNQYHNYRDEYWIVVSGRGKVVTEGKELEIKKGDTFVFKRGEKHKVTCTSAHRKDLLVAIEVQLGEILDEDDIVRLEPKETLYDKLTGPFKEAFFGGRNRSTE